VTELSNLLSAVFHLLQFKKAEVQKWSPVSTALEKCDDLLQDYPCVFRRANPTRYDGLLNYAVWYYEGSHFPALQWIWPDKAGLFPWQTGVNEYVKDNQPALDHD
jgi:Domain of unknown function (DUF4262)